MTENSDQSKPSGMRNVYAMGIVSFFTDFSTEMILGILPFFIVTGLGASRAILGTIEGSAELVSYAFPIISLSISNKTNKKTKGNQQRRIWAFYKKQTIFCSNWGKDRSIFGKSN